MTDQEINEAIAEAIGARFFTEDGGAFWHFVTKDGRNFNPPTKDLNAMHEVEQKCIYTREYIADEYENNLLTVAEGKPGWKSLYCMVSSTARERAEAFLRTIGKWRDA